MSARTVKTSNGHASVTRNRRSVRLTVVTSLPEWSGKPNAAGFAFVDLDARALERLARIVERERRRLTARAA